MRTIAREFKSLDFSVKPKNNTNPFKSGSNTYLASLIVSLAVAIVVMWLLFNS